MPELPLLSGDEIIRVFKKMGFHIVRQKGSHVVLRKEEKGCVVPLHKEVAVATLRSAIKQAGISPEDFINTFRSR